MTQQPIYVLTVAPAGTGPSGATLHPTFAAAEQFLRDNWDPEGDYEELDFTGLTDELEKSDIWVDIEAVIPDWPSPQDSWSVIKRVDDFAARHEISRDAAMQRLLAWGLGFVFDEDVRGK